MSNEQSQPSWTSPLLLIAHCSFRFVVPMGLHSLPRRHGLRPEWNERPDASAGTFHEPSRTEAGKLVTGNLSLVIGHLEGDTAKRRFRQSPITTDQLPVTSEPPLGSRSQRASRIGIGGYP